MKLPSPTPVRGWFLMRVSDFCTRKTRSEKEEGLPGTRAKEEKSKRHAERAMIVFAVLILIFEISQVIKSNTSNKAAVREKVTGIVIPAITRLHVPNVILFCELK